MILLHKPYRTDLALEYVKDCLDTTWVSSAGKYVTKFESQIADYCGAKYAVAVNSGTSALHLSLVAQDIGAGDAVILPNLTFVASANPVLYSRARPVLIDVEEKSWQLDLDLLEEFLLEETIQNSGKTILKETKEVLKAIIPVHLLGNVVDMKRLQSIAKRYNLLVIEDAAESIGSTYDEKHAGSFGELGCLSFNGNKTITTGGGGMILTNDESLAKRVRHLSTQAKSNPEEYFHDEIGYNYRMTNTAAALGLSQLELLPEILKQKKEIAEQYREELSNFRFQEILSLVKSNNWLVTIRVDNKARLIQKLKENQIQARPLWVPLNQLPMFEDSIYYHKKNISKELYDSCLSLPSSPDLKTEEVNLITQLIQENE